jgi:predicted MPP superfamily phosphohydrolase
VWLIYLAVGLVVMAGAVIYVRRRLGEALAQLGSSRRAVRIVQRVLALAVFAYPVLAIGSMVGSRVLGFATMPRFDGPVATWLLVIPFILTTLVVFQSLPWLFVLELVRLVVQRRRAPAQGARVRVWGTLVIVGAFAVYTPVRILAQRDEVRFRVHRLGQGPATDAPLRIAFVSDVHVDAHTRASRVAELFARINRGQPDLILSGGDWISTGPAYIEDAATAAAALTSRLGTFSVRGDHENFAYLDRARSVVEVEAAMRAHGVTMLADDVRWFAHGGKRIAVLFFENNYVHRITPEGVKRLLAKAAGADYTIVVTHQFDRQLADQVVDRVDLVLAGHTHGGQVNPVIGLLHATLARLETPFTDGAYPRGRTTILVTTGIGVSVVPLRYAAPGSIEQIELRP